MQQAPRSLSLQKVGEEAPRGRAACPASHGAAGPDPDLGHPAPERRLAGPCCLAAAWGRPGIVSAGAAERGAHHEAVWRAGRDARSPDLMLSPRGKPNPRDPRRAASQLPGETSAAAAPEPPSPRLCLDEIFKGFVLQERKTPCSLGG